MKEFFYRYSYIGFYNGAVRECTCLTKYSTYKEACDAAAERIGKLKRRGWAIGQTIIEAVVR